MTISRGLSGCIACTFVLGLTDQPGVVHYSLCFFFFFCFSILAFVCYRKCIVER
jgi:hypothetical protein